MSSLSSIGSSSQSALTPSSSTNSNKITGLSTSGISFDGLVSGLDTNAIIQALLATDQQQVTDLTNQQNSLVSEQTAFKSLEAQLVSLQSATTPLAQTFNNVFAARTATSSDQNIVTASAASGAPSGVYSFTVDNLAQAETIASQGFGSANSQITQGTLQIQVGSGAVSTVTVNSSNNTLQGLANSINNLDGDVTASIINNGSSSNPYQLLLTSKKSGAANTINITNNLAPSGGGATQVNLNTVVQQASDAAITLGSGSGALTITSATNQVEGVFDGVTLNLLGTSAGQPVSVTVANDTTSATTAIQSFVSAYNTLVDTYNQNDTYNQQTGQAGVFLGNTDAASINDSVTNTVTGIVKGLASQANSLAAIGITIDDQGHLNLNQDQLTAALNGQTSGLTLNNVEQIFSLSGQSTNPGIQFVTATNSTTAIAAPIQVQVTQAAAQASLSADTALGSSITIDGTNNALSVSVDGQDIKLTLAQGTYTPQSLVQELQTDLNNSALGAGAIQVGLSSGNQLTFTTTAYGSAAAIAVSGGSALSTLGFSQSGSAHGQDVAGSYIVNGVKYAARGTGQLLTGSSSSGSTSGLSVRVTLNASQITSTPEGTVTVTSGIASQLGQVLSGLLDPVTGRLQSIDQSLQKSENSIQTEIANENSFIQQRQQELVLEFANMETTLASLQEAGNFLNGSLNSFKIPTTNGSSSSASSGSSSATSTH